MFTMPNLDNKLKHELWGFSIISLVLMDIIIILDIQLFRQIFGFLFLTILPGLLILQIFQLNIIGHIEKFVLSVGLSVFFLMFFGLLLNTISLNVGYETPLSPFPLIISFNLAFIILIIISSQINKNPIFAHMDFKLSSAEKVFLTVPILFPGLSVFGMHVMNTTNNNLFLMVLLFLISIFVIFICVFNDMFPNRLYPIIIFLISISLLLILSLRSNHIIGIDTHLEYYLFRATSNNLHWSISANNALDACLSISLLPTIYQSILNVNPEFLFRILYSLICSIFPLVIYLISKRYVKELYAFLTSCFFMFQYGFLWTPIYARTNLAILFFALAMMVLFNDKINLLQKKILFIIFMASVIVSHYSTTYVFFILMLGTFIMMEMISMKYAIKRCITLPMVILFFVNIFYWYSQVTISSFDSGVNFIRKTIINLSQIFIEESRGGAMQNLQGGWLHKSIPNMIEFVFMWLTFALIGIGIITLIIRYKKMSFPDMKFKKSSFLKEKFEVEYSVIAIACSGLLGATFLLPYVSKGYGMDRLYTITATFLSVFFVIGGIIVSTNFHRVKKILTKIQNKKENISRAPFENLVEKDITIECISVKNNHEIWAYLIILLILIPYFLCVTGVMYNIFDVPRAITLNSKGEQYDIMYTHDQESYGAKWLKNHAKKNYQINSADFFGGLRLTSQGGIPPNQIDYSSFINRKKINGYLYLRYTNIVHGEILGYYRKISNIGEYSDIFSKKIEIYDSGGSKIYF